MMFRYLSAIVLAVLNNSVCDAQQPAPRHLEKIVFNKQKHELIVFGGAEFNDGKVTFPGNVATWNGTSWLVSDKPGPGTRAGHGFAFHDQEEVAYVVSGLRNADDGEHVMPDVWTWNGLTWKQVMTDAPVKTSEAVYDPHARRLLVYGDVHNKTQPWKGGDPQVFELWELKKARWKKLSATGPQADANCEIAFDVRRKTLVIPLWESGRSVVWEWQGKKWIRVEAKGDAPVVRARFALAYDNVSGSVYLFGGRNEEDVQFGDFWKWNGTTWQEIRVASAPAPRAAATMEAGPEGVVLYGGVTAQGPSNEMWIWNNTEWKRLSP